VRVHYRTVICIATGEILEDHFYEYSGPVAECKVTDAEKAAQAQSRQESVYLQTMMQTQFGEQQDLLKNVLLPQLTQMANNPEGFGAKALSAMQSQLINTVGSQVSSQEKSIQNQFSTENLAGLGSGVQEAIQANLGASAAGAEATGLQNISIANEQLKNQQQEFGLGGLASATQLLGQAPQAAGLGLGANNQNFNQSLQIANQGSLWQNLLGGVVGAGLNFASGGVSGLAQGGSFWTGGGQALGGQDVTG